MLCSAEANGECQFRLWSGTPLHLSGYSQSDSRKMLQEGQVPFAVVPRKGRDGRGGPCSRSPRHQEPSSMASLLGGAGHHVLGALRGRA